MAPSNFDAFFLNWTKLKAVKVEGCISAILILILDLWVGGGSVFHTKCM